MKIVLINAAAPDYSRKKRYSPSAFAEASVAFAATELKEGTISEAKLDGYHIWHASSLHARQTADMLIGTNTAGRPRGIPSAGRRTSLFTGIERGRCCSDQPRTKDPCPSVPSKKTQIPVSKRQCDPTCPDGTGPGNKTDSHMRRLYAQLPAK